MKESYHNMNESRTFLTLLVFAGIAISVIACNTMEGMGTDIKMTGKALEESAERHKDHSKPIPACHPHCHHN